MHFQRIRLPRHLINCSQDILNMICLDHNPVRNPFLDWLLLERLSSQARKVIFVRNLMDCEESLSVRNPRRTLGEYSRRIDCVLTMTDLGENVRLVDKFGRSVET